MLLWIPHHILWIRQKMWGGVIYFLQDSYFMMPDSFIRHGGLVKKSESATKINESATCKNESSLCLNESASLKYEFGTKYKPESYYMCRIRIILSRTHLCGGADSSKVMSEPKTKMNPPCQKMNPPQKTWYFVAYSHVDLADSLATMADSWKIHEYAISANE